MGTRLLYPHHGAIKHTDLTTRNIEGTPTKSMTLRVHSSELMFQAAIHKAEDTGGKTSWTKPASTRCMSYGESGRGVPVSSKLMEMTFSCPAQSSSTATASLLSS